MDTQNIITELETRITDNCTPIDIDAAYDEMLDECYDLEKVGGPFAHMSASIVLERCDPVAYRCGKNDWLDGEDVCEIDGNYYSLSEAESYRDELVQELENEIEANEQAHPELIDVATVAADDARPEVVPIRQLATLRAAEWSK